MANFGIGEHLHVELARVVEPRDREGLLYTGVVRLARYTADGWALGRFVDIEGIATSPSVSSCSFRLDEAMGIEVVRGDK